MQSTPKHLPELSWLRGPEFLRNASEISIPGEEQAFLSADEPEVRKELKLLMTRTTSPPHGSGEIQEILILVLPKASYCCCDSQSEISERHTWECQSQHIRYLHLSPEVMAQATEVIIKSVQRETFKKDLDIIAQSSSRDNGSYNGAKAKRNP